MTDVFPAPGATGPPEGEPVSGPCLVWIVKGVRSLRRDRTALCNAPMATPDSDWWAHGTGSPPLRCGWTRGTRGVGLRLTRTHKQQLIGRGDVQTWGHYLALIVVIGVLLMSLVGKFRAPADTLQVLSSVWHLSGAAIVFGVICAVEAALVTALCFAPLRRLAFLLTALTVSVFSVSILLQLLQGSSLGCGCGLGGNGLSPQVSQLIGLLRNVLLLILCLGLWRGAVAAQSR